MEKTMSTRHLVEFDGDTLERIRDNPEAFANALVDALSHGDTQRKDDLWCDWQMHYIGTRHHSVAYTLNYGGVYYPRQ